MGQYHAAVNLDRQEFIWPHGLGAGLKLREQTGHYLYTTALIALLAVSSGRGDGDFREGGDIVGRWGGDRVAIIGDYAEPADLPDFAGEVVSNAVFSLDPAGHGWTDITAEVRTFVETECDIEYVGTGYGCLDWKERER